MRQTRTYWHESTQQSKEFTSKLMRWWFEKHGGQLVGRNDSPDLVCVSFCSSREIPLLTAARKIADAAGCDLLVGGPECYTGSTYLAWADHMCVGEGYRLIAALATDGLAALEMPHVLSRSDPHALISPDYFVPWRELPPVQTAKKIYYYLSGRGCHRKCRFCMTSWVQPHQECTEIVESRALRRLPKGSKSLFVTNDAGRGEGAGSTTLRRFLDSKRDDWPMVIRIGIEGVTERRRRQLSKPISDADIAAAFVKAREIKRQLQLFWIIGFGGDAHPHESMAELMDLLPLDEVRSPRIYNKYTWFEPSPHTPLARYDLRRIQEWPYMDAHAMLRAKSGRVRVFRAGRVAVSIWSAVLRRLPHDAALRWYAAMAKASDAGLDGARDMAESIVGVGFLSGESVAPWMNIRTLQSAGRPYRTPPDYRMPD